MKANVHRLDPVNEWVVEAAVTHPVFDELFEAIVEEEPAGSKATVLFQPHKPSPVNRRRRRSIVAVVAVLMLVGALVGIRSVGHGNVLTHPITTDWQQARTLKSGGSSHGTWQLVDAVLSGAWQHNDDGPPPGYLTCTTDGRCYVMAGKYSSAAAGAPLLSESLYTTIDQGANWAVLPMPNGFAPSTALSCSGTRWCAAGGTYQGQPVLLTTTDGGHSFTLTPLPSGMGKIHVLSCPSVGACDALVASSTGHNGSPIEATFLTITRGGRTFVDHPILHGDSMVALACTSSAHCTVVGETNRTQNSLLPSGVTAVTSNGGTTWKEGSIPAGFGIRGLFSPLVCSDATHCVLGGVIPIRNAETCPGSTTTGPSLASFAMSPSVRAISNTESQIAAKATSSFDGATSCSTSAVSTVSAFATSTDGGLSWTPRSFPSDVPTPQITGLACSTLSECWASGSESIPQKIGKVIDFGSSVLLGTTNGGTSWSKVTFQVPPSAQNPQGQSYQAIGSISCPSHNFCFAEGVTAQGAGSDPTYSLTIPQG